MTCLQNNPQGAGILMDYCAGTLDAASSAQLEAHFRNCAACNQAAEDQRKVWQALDEWKPEEVSLDFDQRLYARIAAESREPWWRPSLRKPLVPAINIISTRTDKDPLAWRQWHHWNLMTNIAEVKLPKGVGVLTLHVLTEGNMNLACLDFKSKTK